MLYVGNQEIIRTNRHCHFWSNTWNMYTDNFLQYKKCYIIKTGMIEIA